MGYELWNHSKYLPHKVRNMMRRGWLLKTYNDKKMLRGKVQTAEKIINDEIDFLNPVGFVSHVKNDEKSECITMDIGGDTSRRVVTMVMGDREEHPQPDEGEAWLYAPGNKKMFARMKMKKKQGGGQGGGGGSGGGGRLEELLGVEALMSGGGGGGQKRAQTKDYGRVEGFHWNSDEEKGSGQNKSTFQLKTDKGMGYKTDGNYDIKAANATQFEAGKHVRKGSTYRDGDTYTQGIEHATDHIAGGGANVGSLPSAREIRAMGDGGQGGSGEYGPPKETPDGTQNMQASGIPGNISLKGMAAAMGMSSVSSSGEGGKTGGGVMGQMDQMQQRLDQLEGGVGPGGGVPEAPATGQMFARRGSDKTWQPIVLLQGPPGEQGIPGPPGPPGPGGVGNIDGGIY